MADFDCVPIVDVTRENVNEVYQCMVFYIRNASFIAIDLELSGLGNRRDINAKSIEDRFKALSEVAKTRAIISLGISCFTESLQAHEVASDKGKCSKRYQVQTFNLLCLCSEEYTVEPDSLLFLVKHGFDFNRQYVSGLSYSRGSTKVSKKDDYLRQLFHELLKSRRPLVLHNGFVDLMFLYGNLYCNIPNSLATFLADLEQMFPEGIFDTKYLAEFRERLSASFLEYVFRKRQLVNWERSLANHPCVELAFVSFPASFSVNSLQCKLRTVNQIELPEVCKWFANHGWCSKSSSCPQSHNVDDILEAESRKRRKRRKTKRVVPGPDDNTAMETEQNGHVLIEVNSEGQVNSKDDPTKVKLVVDVMEAVDLKKVPSTTSSNVNVGVHRAGYDAFMTGFIFATHLTTVKEKSTELELTKNRLYLCGKDVPLLIVASNFAKPSPGHLELAKKIGIL